LLKNDLRDIDLTDKQIVMNDVNPSLQKIDISIIIVNYNLAKEIENCLNSLLKKIGSAGRINYEIIIVDNNSPDKRLLETEKKLKRNCIQFYK